MVWLTAAEGLNMSISCHDNLMQYASVSLSDSSRFPWNTAGKLSDIYLLKLGGHCSLGSAHHNLKLQPYQIFTAHPVGHWWPCNIKWAASWQNQQNGMCAQQTLSSAWASAQSDQSSLSAWWKPGPLATHWVHSEDSDQTGKMPRLTWVFAGRTSVCWFCHEAAQIMMFS